VFAFVAYACAVWYAAARWRRRWAAVAWVLAGLLGCMLVAYFHWRLNVWTHGEIYLPVLRVLLYPYTVMVVAVGLFIACLPRRAIGWEHCPGCEYDLRGLDEPIETCPECGMSEELAELTYGRRQAFPAGPRTPRISREAPAMPSPEEAPPREARRWLPIGSPAGLAHSPDQSRA
jgi:hypothetical protein